MRWVKFWTRNFGLFRYYIYIESNKLPYYRERFGRVFDYALTVPDGKLVAYYHDEQELAEMTEAIFSASCRDAETFERYSEEIFSWMQEFIDFNDGLRPEELEEKDVLPTFRVWYDKYLHWQIGIYFYFVLEPIVTNRFLAAMENYLRKRSKLEMLQEYTEIVMAPERMNAVLEEERDACFAAAAITEENREELVEKHYRKYLWIPCYDIKDDPHGLSFFSERIGKLEKDASKRRVEELDGEFRKRKERFSELIGTIEEKGLRELAKIMHSLVFYKDHRDDLRRRAGYAGKPFMAFLGKRIGLTLEEVNYLSPPELIAALGGEPVDAGSIRQRIPSDYVLMSTGEKTRLFTGEDVHKVVYEQLTKNEGSGDAEVAGLSASKGKARGRVAIVRHSVSLGKVKEGDVIVAVTTHPEYVPAMRKAAAIVTDEGGVTSHAAIVSREMGKPCIVGAKSATNRFKDGDLVEVDADNGVVRKL